MERAHRASFTWLPLNEIDLKVQPERAGVLSHIYNLSNVSCINLSNLYQIENAYHN